MIQVTLGTNTDRKVVTVDPARTVKSVLEENNIDYSRGGIHLDGTCLKADALNKSFSENGVRESCILISVIKGDGGLN